MDHTEKPGDCSISKEGLIPTCLMPKLPFKLLTILGMQQLLVQFIEGKIGLLPALTDAWSEGSFKGLCAGVGFIESLGWNNKILKKLNIFARNNSEIIPRYSNVKQKI